jgi:hypothetical protein
LERGCGGPRLARSNGVRQKRTGQDRLCSFSSAIEGNGWVGLPEDVHFTLETSWRGQLPDNGVARVRKQGACPPGRRGRRPPGQLGGARVHMAVACGCSTSMGTHCCDVYERVRGLGAQAGAGRQRERALAFRRAKPFGERVFDQFKQ